MTTPTTIEDLAALERFVVENDDLLELETLIGTFNIFDALRIERTEIRHSNFLAWLLDPTESHGQGDLFLKPLLMDILKRTPAARRPLGPVDLDGLELTQVEIRREWRNIDLLIESRDPPIVIAIENKVDSGEHSGQLQRYEDTVTREFGGVPQLFVFLTPDGDDASDEDWIPCSYGDVHRVFTRVRAASKGSLGSDVATFLDHYLSLIGSQFMANKDVESLCKKIHTNHRRAVELLIEYVGAAASGVDSAVERFFRDRPNEWNVLRVKGKMVHFVPASWIGTVCEEDGTPCNGVPARVFLETDHWRRSKSLHARWIIGPGPDTTMRKVFLDYLLKRPELELVPQRKQLTDVWTRVWTSKVMEWEEDQIPGEESVAEALARTMGSIAPRLARLPEAVRAFKP